MQNVIAQRGTLRHICITWVIVCSITLTQYKKQTDWQMLNVSEKTLITKAGVRPRKVVRRASLVPANILMFQKFAEDFFDPANPNPRQMLTDYKEFITHVSFAGEADTSTEEVMNEFFEF